jgi:hypothetical protein
MCYYRKQAVLDALAEEWYRDVEDYRTAVRAIGSLPTVEPPKKVVAQIKVDVDEVVERIKEEYEIKDRPVCDDCISRAETIKAMCAECEFEAACRGDCIEVAVVRGMPPVEPKRPKGKWVKVIDKDSLTVTKWHYECDQCGAGRWEKGQRYCQNCGARMCRGDGEE